jgi:hypothetical protein
MGTGWGWFKHMLVSYGCFSELEMLTMSSIFGEFGPGAFYGIYFDLFSPLATF